MSLKKPPEKTDKKFEVQPYTERLKAGVVDKADLRYEREVILDLYKHHLKLLMETNVFVSGESSVALAAPPGVPNDARPLWAHPTPS